jgi:hypothetical protein
VPAVSPTGGWVAAAAAAVVTIVDHGVWNRIGCVYKSAEPIVLVIKYYIYVMGDCPVVSDISSLPFRAGHGRNFAGHGKHNQKHPRKAVA